VRQLEIKVLNITDARCNREVWCCSVTTNVWSMLNKLKKYPLGDLPAAFFRQNVLQLHRTHSSGEYNCPYRVSAR